MPACSVVTGQKIAAEKLERARQLRRDMTPAEAALWQALRRNKLGRHFRRQQIIAGFIVDFFCQAAALVIEVDGGVHRGLDNKTHDARRDEALAAMGLHVERVQNDDVLTNLPRILERIRTLLHEGTP